MMLKRNKPGDAPWLAAMRPQYEEHTVDRITDVEGAIPADLRGTLCRIGPGKHDVGGQRYHHWFDGDGMISAFRIADGAISFRNRYIRTPTFEAEQQAGRQLYMNFGTPYFGSMIRAARKPLKNPANTNIVRMANKMYALWEGGRPVEVDPDTFDYLGEEDFDGLLGRTSMFSAHPHHDPETGEWFNIGLLPGRTSKLRIYRIGPDGAASELTRIPLARPFMIHDFVVSRKHIVILAGPLYMTLSRLPGAILGRRSLADCFAWHDGEPMWIYVLNRDGSDLRTIETDPGMMIHAANAYEDGDDIVADVCLFPDGTPLQQVADAFAGRAPRGESAQLTRLRIAPDGRITREPLTDRPLEFPRVADHLSAQRHRNIYGLEFTEGSFGSGRLLQVDTERGDTRVTDFGDGCFAGEPIFVPRPGAADDADGWLLSMVFDGGDNHTFLGIADARSGDIVARAHLPFHIPLAFHGNFFPDT